MNWYKIAQLSMSDEVLDSHSGQTDLRLNAKNTRGETVGYIDYTEFRGEVHIKYIEVLPEHRRQGVGTELMRSLQKLYPNTEINTGMLTDEGSALYQALPKQTIENKMYDTLSNQKEEKSKRLKDIERQLDIFYSAPEVNAETQQEFRSLGDEWNTLYDEVRDIESQLNETYKSKILID